MLQAIGHKLLWLLGGLAAGLLSLWLRGRLEDKLRARIECHACKDANGDGCLRCGRPRCAMHVDEKNYRCPTCEAHFLKKISEDIEESHKHQYEDADEGFQPALVPLFDLPEWWLARRRFLKESVRARPRPFSRGRDSALPMSFFLDEVFHVERIEDVDAPERLSETELNVFCIIELTVSVQNGGLDRYFFNSSGARSGYALAALQTIGATELCGIFQDALAKFPKGRPAYLRMSRRDQMAKFSPKGKAFRHLDKAFCEFPDDLELLLGDYWRRAKRSTRHALATAT